MTVASNTVVASGSMAGPNLNRDIKAQLGTIASTYADLFGLTTSGLTKGSDAALFEAFGLPVPRLSSSKADLYRSRGNNYGYREELTARLNGHVEQVKTNHINSAVSSASAWIAASTAAVQAGSYGAMAFDPANADKFTEATNAGFASNEQLQGVDTTTDTLGDGAAAGFNSSPVSGQWMWN